MLKKRIIPCLDIQNGRTVKGINFLSIKDAGDPIELAKKYVSEGADELVFLDITATIEKRETLLDLVENISREIDIPFTVGGGINSVEDATKVISAGADKVSVNSAAVKRPELITEMASRFGSQCVVLAIDTKKIEKQWQVFINGGGIPSGLETIAWAQRGIELGAGEILLTSMNNDGTKKGFALDLVGKLAKKIKVPLIASGGAGSMEDFKSLFSQTNATGGLAASVFHYGEIPIPKLKNYLKTNQIPIR